MSRRQKQGWNPLCRTLKTVFPKRSSTTRIRFGKAGAHPQLALGIAIAPETLFHHYNLLILKAIAILSICLQILVHFHLLRKCGLLAHTSAAFLKNCCTEKLLFACGSNSATCFQCIKNLPFMGGFFVMILRAYLQLILLIRQLLL